MEISEFNVGLGATRQGVDWGWLQSRVRSSRRGHPAEQVKAMKEGLERLKVQGIEAIED